MGENLIAIRGATTCTENTKESIISATSELLKAVLLENHVDSHELVSIIFTATPDITAAFPAQAARGIGLTDVPLLGAQEIVVEGAPKLCIRVMLHVNRQQPRSMVNHIYLHGAKALRPDLVRPCKINIAIDGPAGAGKSTVAKELAKCLGLRYLDTGAMYRALTYVALKQEIDVASESSLAEVAAKLDFGLDDNSRITLAGRALGEEIRTPEVTSYVSLVSSHALVREVIVEQQRQIAKHGGIVMDGRDIGTTVMVDAPVKVFLTANLEERARRRRTDLQSLGHESSINEVTDQLRQRDHLDSTRVASPLKPADDAVILDSTDLSISEVIDKILEIVHHNTEGKTC